MKARSIVIMNCSVASFCALVIAICFLLMSCANYTQRGAAYGAGAGTIASVLADTDPRVSAILILSGALLGGVIGNTMDEQAKQTSLQNKGKKVLLVEEEPSQRTDCKKVTTKTWKDGEMISQKTEEVCTGRKTTNTY